MRFLADESCDFAVVRVLRQAGHDVTAVLEITPRANDQTVLDLATREKRILVTEDKDFGRLAFATGRGRGGVILIRYPGRARQSLLRDLLRLVGRHGQRLMTAFTVVQPGRIRIHHTTPFA